MWYNAIWWIFIVDLYDLMGILRVPVRFSMWWYAMMCDDRYAMIHDDTRCAMICNDMRWYAMICIDRMMGMIYICLQCLLSILVGAAQSRVGVALVFLHLLSVCLILFCISYLTLTMWSCHNNFFSIFCCVWYCSVFHLAVGFTASRGRLLVYMICMRMIWVITGTQLDIEYFT